MTFERHRAVHGEPPARGGGRKGRSQGALIEELARAGLSGRGGGAFPSALKLKAVASSRGRPILVANAMEGDPSSLKDEVLLENAPHLVIDGILAASEALGAREAILCIGRASVEARLSFERALGERERAGDPAREIGVVELADRYIAGQESAIVSALGGGPAIPMFLRQRLPEHGLGGRPTLVQNVETLAHAGMIARHGSQWFRERGTSALPGTALVTLWSPGESAVIHEIDHGTPLSALIERDRPDAKGLRGVLIGGYAGTWIDGSRIADIRLCNEQLSPLGARLGLASIILLSSASCPVWEITRVTRWLASQSAGQCGPCLHGLDALAGHLEEAMLGRAPAGVEREISRLHPLLRGRGACAYPDGTSGFVESAVRVFSDELADHVRHGHCDACYAPGTLPLPTDAGPPPPRRARRASERRRREPTRTRTPFDLGSAA